MPKYDYLITGMTCANCSNAIENRLREFKNPPLQNIHVNLLTETATISFDGEYQPDSLQKDIAQYIEEIGFGAEPLINSVTDEPNTTSHQHEKILNNKKKLIRKYWAKGIIGIIGGGLVMGLMMSGILLPMTIMILMGISSTLLTFFLGFESYKKVFYSLKINEFNSMDLLFSISTSVMIILSLTAFVFPWLPMMFDAPILIYAFRHIGKAIQEQAKKTEFEQTSFRNRAPLWVRKINENNKISLISLHDAKPGDTIIVKSDEIIPLDGVCLTEESWILTTIKDGATEPQKITKNAELLAGMKVSSETVLIKIKVTKNENDSNLAAMEKSLQQDDNTTKAKLQKTAENILKYFVPTIFILAITFGIALSFLFPPIAAIQCAISILTAVCPCTFGLITPLAITMAKAKAVENGFQFTTANALQKSSDIDTYFFDLNGTLTVGKCTVVRHNIPKAMMPYLAALESGKRNHLIGRALYHYAKSQHDSKNDLTVTYTNKYPLAVSAKIDGHDYTIGNAKQMRESGFTIHAFHQEIKNIDAEHIVYFAKDKEVVGFAALEDPLRPEAKEVIRRLEEMGKTVYICTGAIEKTALIYQKKLGVSKIFYECLPDSKDEKANTKTNHIRRLQKEGHKVAMIGDGENDALVIHASDFGIAIKSAASDPVTRSLSDAIIQEGSLWPIITAIHIAKDAVSNIKQNLFLSLSYNLLCVVVISVIFTTIGFAINPAVGAFFMMLQAGFIYANAKRFRNNPTPKPPKLEVDAPLIKESSSSYGKMMLNEFKPDVHCAPEIPMVSHSMKPIFCRDMQGNKVIRSLPTPKLMSSL